MRRQFIELIPVTVAIAFGIFVLLSQFFDYELLNGLGGVFVEWAALIAAFAVLLGLLNVISVHLQRVARREKSAISSLIILLTALIVFIVVLPSGGSSSASMWVFRYLYQPLEASFLALLVFFIAAAAYRSLRVRSWETGLFVAAALIVLIGAAPIASSISPLLPAAKEWVLNVPAVAGVRGILLGVALGVIATGLRLLTGIDRPYSE